jgi:hypothetical protein
LRLVRIDPSRNGVRVQPMPTTPFVPEVPHAEVVLDGVSVAADEILPGDGYERYIRTFRTVEDVFVMAASAAHLLRVGLDAGWPQEVVARILASLSALEGLATEAVWKAPAAHLALSQVLVDLRGVANPGAEHWQRVDPEIRARWQRDVPLLAVASEARFKRAEVAWGRLRSG